MLPLPLRTIAVTELASPASTVTIADTDTDDLAGGQYYHRLRRTDAGSEQVLSFGNVILKTHGGT